MAAFGDQGPEQVEAVADEAVHSPGLQAAHVAVGTAVWAALVLAAR